MGIACEAEALCKLASPLLLSMDQYRRTPKSFSPLSLPGPSTGQTPDASRPAKGADTEKLEIQETQPVPQPSTDQANSSCVDDAMQPKRKAAFDRDGPVEAVALQSDWQFWNVFSDVRTIGKGHFAKVKQVQHTESLELF